MQLIEKQSPTRLVRLKPLPVDDQLRDGPLAHVPDHLGRGSRIGIHINLRVGNPVRIQELLGRAAIPAPPGRINLHLHATILLCRTGNIGNVTAEEIKTLLQLEPHPIEGGHFRRTYTAAAALELPRGIRAAGTAIYYLLEPGTFSEMHVLDSDEIFHFYLGDPVEMVQLYPDGRSAVFVLGQDLQAGQRVQLIVPAGVWQGTRLISDGQMALFGCTVTPGFDFSDYRNASYEELVAKWPGEAERIKALTRS